MPRNLRASAAGIPEHVIQRGSNRQVIFTCEADMKAYVTWLKERIKGIVVAYYRSSALLVNKQTKQLSVIDKMKYAIHV